MDRAVFEAIVREELERLPPMIRDRVENVAWVVRDRPDRSQRREHGGDLLGLYEGTPLDARAFGPPLAMPDRIFLFQDAIEDEAEGDPAGIRRVVRETLLHEIAHHFGFSEDEVEAWEREQEERRGKGQ